MISEKLKEAGVEVDYKLYNGATHEFFGMATVVPDAKDTQAYAFGKIRNSFK